MPVRQAIEQSLDILTEQLAGVILAVQKETGVEEDEDEGGDGLGMENGDAGGAGAGGMGNGGFIEPNMNGDMGGYGGYPGGGTYGGGPGAAGSGWTGTGMSPLRR